MVAEFLRGTSPPRTFVTAHVHLLLVGFVLLLVMGVATWIFPRAAGARIVVAAGGLGQLLGSLLFVVNMWGRVRMPSGLPRV